MDYIYLAQILFPVIIVTIAAKLIINSLDSQVDTLVALTNYQEEEIAELNHRLQQANALNVRLSKQSTAKPLDLDIAL